MIQPGTVIDGKYRVEKMLGEGGMAMVFAAMHVHLNERVAIKVLLPGLAGNPTVVERFMREARAAVRLKSEHVVRVSDVGTLASQQPYIVMEFLDGTDVEGLLKERGKLPAHETVDYVLQVCEALAEAHAAGIVHRDIKPANFVLTRRSDGRPCIKVLDFGIAKLTLADAGPKLTNTQATMGTPAFMSPEQIRGAKDVDHRGDIWSLGVVLFQLLTGSVPYYAPTYAKLVMQVMRDPTPSIPGIPPGLDAAIQRCLAKDRAHRYQSVAELAQALEPFASDRAEASVLVQRCVGLARAQARIATPPAGVPTMAGGQGAPMHTPAHGMPPMQTPAHGMHPMNTPAHGMHPMNTPAHGMHPMNTPAHGMNPMHTPAHGMNPMGTPAHGMPPSNTPAHGMPPSNTPAHGMPPSNTPAHGMPPSNTPAHGMPPSNTPAHGMPPSNTPAHGMPPSNTPAHGMPPSNTPAHGMPPMNQGGSAHMMSASPMPAHHPHAQTGSGLPPHRAEASPISSPATAASASSSKRVLWIVLVAVIAGSIAGLVVLLS